MRCFHPARLIGLGLILAAVPLSSQSSQAQQSSTGLLKNNDVVEMLKGGISQEIVIAKIKSSACEFDTSPAELKELKSSNVPDAVILVMVQAPSKLPSTTETPSLPYDQVHDYCAKYIGAKYLGADGREQTCVTLPASVSSSVLPANRLRSVAWRAVPWVTTTYYQQPGSANTDCVGSGNWIGNTWNANSSCTTQYTPAQNVPINWTHLTVYNEVETADSRMVLTCTRNWAFSKCVYLVPGEVFQFQDKNGKIEVIGRRAGKDKDQPLDYEIVSRQPK